jgi:hypothetical protein
MLEDWTKIKSFFSCSGFFKLDNSNLITFIGFIFYTIAIIVRILKLIYDINLKFQAVVHIISLLNECINLTVSIFFML